MNALAVGIRGLFGWVFCGYVYVIIERLIPLTFLGDQSESESSESACFRRAVAKDESAKNLVVYLHRAPLLSAQWRVRVRPLVLK
jgi:hypothetical protein